MFQHGDIWRALDNLAASRGLSASALAKRAGLDSTTFNKSKRVTRDGKLRWPSTESVSKVLTAVNATTVEFVTYLGSAEPERRRRMPVIGYAMAGKDGYFDDAGYPAGSGWDEVAFPDLEDPHCYALEVTGDSMTPVYRDGDIIIVSPHGQLRRVVQEYGASVAGTAMMASTVVIDQAMATWLGDSQVSALALGSKVIAFVLMLAAGSLSTAAIPYASQLAAAGDAASLKALADRFLKWVMLATVPLVALLVLFAHPIIAVVFQRGAFDAKDTELVAAVHAAFAFQIPFYVMNVLLLRLIAALRANTIILQGAAINFVVNIVGNFVLMQVWCVVGIAVATVLVYVASFAFLYWRLRGLAGERPAGLGSAP